MQTETILYIIIAGVIALGLACFQYATKRKALSRSLLLFAFFRFLTIFCVLLLLINPNFNLVEISVEKPNLLVVVDNSSSIKHLEQDKKALHFIETLKSNGDIQDKFNLKYYTFGEQIKSSNSNTFLEKQTIISAVFTQLNQVYKQTTSPTILITDGNQTYGNDYQFSSNSYKQPIYPVILGDTITYVDLKIKQLNVNRYAFLKNRFPIETILIYNGNSRIKSNFLVKSGNTVVYSKEVNFSKNDNSKIISFTLPANKVGVIDYTATIVPLASEKNTVNNSKNFAIEVINQKTKIALVSNFSHPDLGALKKSIESNEQRTVTILSPNEIINQINNFQLFILYQPNEEFNALYNALDKENKNKFVIIGPKTNLAFLNRISKNYTQDITYQTENYQAELNLNYLPFIIEDLNFESFPPLLSCYGDVKFNLQFQTILEKRVRGVSINQPLIATYETNTRRDALLFGENIWKWRAQSFINEKSFKKFDDFIGKLVQYLSSSKQKNRLNLEYESFYNGSENIIIKAEFFDKNYELDTRETLDIILESRSNAKKNVIPFTIKNNNYQVDLSSLAPSKYDFTVKAKNENISKSGSFQILEYNVEDQFLNADFKKLQLLAANSSGSSYFIDNTQNIVEDLLNDNRFLPTQKSIKNRVPLIDWKYLLAIIIISLGLEWFLRKYNGLI